MVHGHGGGGVPGAEDRREDAAHAAPQLPGAGLAHAVAHQVHGASLPGRPLEDLAYGPDQVPMGIGYDSVSTTDTPSTRLQSDSSQPIAVTTAVEATRPRGGT